MRSRRLASVAAGVCLLLLVTSDTAGSASSPSRIPSGYGEIDIYPDRGPGGGRVTSDQVGTLPSGKPARIDCSERPVDLYPVSRPAPRGPRGVCTVWFPLDRIVTLRAIPEPSSSRLLVLTSQPTWELFHENQVERICVPGGAVCRLLPSNYVGVRFFLRRLRLTVVNTDKTLGSVGSNQGPSFPLPGRTFAAIACGLGQTSCSAFSPYGQRVSLSPVPDQRRTTGFTSFTGCDPPQPSWPSQPTCWVTMKRPRTVTISWG
jgi:hypothetical protein